MAKTSITPTKNLSMPTKIPRTLTKKLHCFIARQFLSQIYALCWGTFYGPKKYGGVPKMTNMRYASPILHRWPCVWIPQNWFPNITSDSGIWTHIDLSGRRWTGRQERWNSLLQGRPGPRKVPKVSLTFLLSHSLTHSRTHTLTFSILLFNAL